MHCPDCSNPFICPCGSCTKRAEPNSGAPWIERVDSFQNCFHRCPQCGLEKNIEDWMEIEWEQMKRNK